jgi:hypothetical protein
LLHYCLTGEGTQSREYRELSIISYPETGLLVETYLKQIHWSHRSQYLKVGGSDKKRVLLIKTNDTAGDHHYTIIQ